MRRLTIVITDLLDFDPEYYDIFTSDDDMRRCKTLSDIIHGKESLRGQMLMPPKVDCLLLFTVSNQLICGGYYYASSPDNHLFNGEIDFPEGLITFDPFDVYSTFSYELQVNSTVVKTQKETMYYLEEKDYDNDIGYELAYSRFNSTLFEEEEKEREELIQSWFQYRDAISLLRSDLPSYMRMDEVPIFDTNTLLAIMASNTASFCFCCDQLLPGVTDQRPRIKMIRLHHDRKYVDLDSWSYMKQELDNYAILCPACYHLHITQGLPYLELDKIKKRARANTLRIIEKIQQSSSTENKKFESTISKEVFDLSCWASESVLKNEGYSVSKKIGLKDYERADILERVIEQRILSKRQVIKYLELQIALRRRVPLYSDAVVKWKKDLEHIGRP